MIKRPSGRGWLHFKGQGRSPSSHLQSADTMNFKPPVWLGALFLLIIFGEPAMATEEPVFTASLKEGAFEIRSYPALVAAQISVTGTRDEGSSRASP